MSAFSSSAPMVQILYKAFYPQVFFKSGAQPAVAFVRARHYYPVTTMRPLSLFKKNGNAAVQGHFLLIKRKRVPFHAVEPFVQFLAGFAHVFAELTALFKFTPRKFEMLLRKFSVQIGF